MRVERLGLALCVGAWIGWGCSDGGGSGPGGGVPAPSLTAGRGGAGSGGGAAAAGSAGTAGSAGMAGTAGVAGTAGTAGAAGAATAGASGAGTAGAAPEDDAGAGMCAPPANPLIDPETLPSCASDTCQNAHCLPRGAIRPVELADRLADCDADNECVPDLFIVTLGAFLLESCRSIDDTEGRCVSTCVPRVAGQIDVLPLAGCEAGERCAPCFDPFTGEETGACGQGCDPGATEEPYLLPDCCGGLGVCVTESYVPADQVALLGRDSCSDAARLCAPREFAEDRSAVPASCESLLQAEGRCLPACLPAVAAQADRLPQAGCPADHLCAPCYDPVTGAATSACAIADDAPVDDPVVFAECCGGSSACVPEALVPEDQQALLDATGCQSGELCAPKDIASGSYVPERCSSWGGSEGRCLLECLPDVQTQSARLTRGVCDQGELCVPCFDPVSGDSTGACELEDDAPIDPAPYVFPTCCDDGAGNDLGTCVPGALVPAAQHSLLGTDSCTDQGFLCAPTTVAAGAYAPEACSSWLNAEARCLPACLPPVAAQQDRLQRDLCGQGELCVPCYDLVSGDSTGACEIAPDAPVDAPVRFPTCCSIAGEPRGTCVPIQAAGAQGDSLPVLDCEDQTGDNDAYVCAPNEKIADPAYQFPSCQTTCGSNLFNCGLGALAGIFDQPGACVPACILSETATPIAGNAAALYGQSTCAAGEDCGPCDDPQTGDPTGLCE